MAYYNQNQNSSTNSLGMNEKKKEDEEKQAQGTVAPVQLTSASATTSDAPTGPVHSGNVQNKAPATAPSSGMGGGFQSYLKANQGVATNRLNQAAQQNVQNQGKQAQTGINQANTAFTKKVDQGSLANRYQAVQDVANLTNQARQTTAPAPAPAAPQNAAAAPANNALAGLDQKAVERFKEVIHAKYKGPESLRQAGLYEGAQNKVTTAQNTLNQTKTASGREEMLRNLFQQRGDYTRGLNKLDAAVLNSSQDGVASLQQAAQAQGNLQNKLDKAQIESANTAQNRAQEITNIRDEAKNTFSQGKKAEEAATEQRLASVVKDWHKLPEHFKEVIRNREKTSQEIYNRELDTFVKANPKIEQNVLHDAGVAYTHSQRDLERFLSLFDPKDHDRLFRSGIYAGGNDQIVYDDLFNKANQQKSHYEDTLKKYETYNKGIADIEKMYGNKNAAFLNSAEAAILGVQSGEGLYNLGENAIKTRNAEKDRLISKDEQARQAVLAALAGLDQAKTLDTTLKYGNAEKAGTQTAMDALDLESTRKAITEAEKNFQDFATNATLTGHGGKKNKTSGKYYSAQESANLRNLLENSGYKFGQQSDTPAGNEELLRNLVNVSSSKDLSPASGPVSTSLEPVSNSLNNITGQSIFGDVYGGLGDLIANSNPVSGAIADILGKVAGPGLNVVGGLFGGGSSSKESKADAAMFARQDLERKVQDAISNSGFQNRVNVKNNETTNKRLTALQQLLANLDKTNL